MKKIFILSFFVSLLFASQINAQWWVQGGNLLWPYGDVTIQNDLNVEGNINGVKKYVALLTQTGTNAPVATVLENTLGGTVVWSRDGAGIYSATLAGAFTENKTVMPQKLFFNNGSDDYTICGLVWVSANVFSIVTNGVVGGVIGNATDDCLTGAFIEIRVYP